MTAPTMLVRVAGDVWLHVLETVCAVDDGVVHAVGHEQVLPWGERPPSRRRKTWDTVCGMRSAPWLLPTGPRPDEVIGTTSVPWPPEVAGLRRWGLTRCRACHAATGRKRPRTRMRRPTEAEEARS